MDRQQVSTTVASVQLLYWTTVEAFAWHLSNSAWLNFAVAHGQQWSEVLSGAAR